jgi:foldase protein PrsA
VFKSIRFLSALGAVFFAVVGLSACGGGVPSNAVVQVGGTPITKSTFEHWMTVASQSQANATPGSKPVLPVPPDYTACIAHLEALQPHVKGQTPTPKAELKSQCEQQYKSAQQEVLSFLISSSWVLGEAESLGVHVSDAEVKKQFEKLKTQEFPKSGEFEKFLATSGQSVSDLLLRVKLNMLSSKIQQKVVKNKAKPTQAQIEKYYKEHASQFGTAEKRSVQLLIVKSEAEAAKAKKEIESGKSFVSVAQAVTSGPQRGKAGQVTVVEKGQETKALDERIFSSPVGTLGGPVKTPFGYYIYKVVSITKGTVKTLAQSQAAIKQQLTATQQQAALTSFVAAFKKKWTAKTECREGFVVMDCKSYKAPKGASGASGATGVT